MTGFQYGDPGGGRVSNMGIGGGGLFIGIHVDRLYLKKKEYKNTLQWFPAYRPPPGSPLVMEMGGGIDRSVQKSIYK